MNSLLARQLRRLGLDESRPPTDARAWAGFLESIGRSYDDSDQSRYLLERSLRVSSREMRAMYDELRASSELREAEQQHRFRTVVEGLDDGLCILDPGGSVEFANRAAARIIGTPPDGLVGEAILERFRFRPDEPAPPLDTERVVGIVAGGEVFTDDTALLSTPGRDAVPVSCVLSPLGSPGGGGGSVLLFRDLTERRRALDAIRHTEQHYRTLFHSIPIAVFEQDFSGVSAWIEERRREGVTDLRALLEANPEEVRPAIGLIETIDANPASLAMLETDRVEDVLGPLDPDMAADVTLASFCDQVLAIWDQRQTTSGELTGRTTKGNRVDALFHWSASRIEGALDLTRVLFAMTDITDRKQVEEQLADLVRAKDQFIAAASHELRTPLTIVCGAADLLDREWDALPEDHRRELVASLSQESHELSNLVEDLLVAARADVGSLNVRAKPIDLRAETDAALRTAVASDDTSIDTGAVHGTALADPLRFRQIVRNLATNAIRYGGPTVRVAVAVAGGTVALRVTDDGPGVPADQQDAIFEPYHRAHSRPGVPGSVGLGLTVSRQLARRMGGDLIYSREGGMTVFELTLPAADRSEAPQPAPVP
ncbi:MAG: PAS domain-containing sensor histidine kinase [Actinobacteria bacterium]|nr:PAS domain-containing sensor histidine kinase [Actinomycetota bacterium]